MKTEKSKTRIKDLPRNIWAVSLTSFFMDISSEMVINIIPLFLSNVLGVRTNIIGLIEGVAESTASLLKLFSGWMSGVWLIHFGKTFLLFRQQLALGGGSALGRQGGEGHPHRTAGCAGGGLD
jgi:hypothetical protein